MHTRPRADQALTHQKSPYIGRFAPSPTGPLHFGSLVAALGSYLDARCQQGKWLLRIDDVDSARSVAGSAESILATLSRLGFEWDDNIVWQSQNQAAYARALAQLLAKNLAYPCACSRREIADSTLARDGSRCYPGTCRNGLPANRQPRAWRLRVKGCIHFTDLLQGAQHETLQTQCGDFVIQRADGLFAYQLAVTVDDALAGVTHVVRGADLLFSTARQIFLQRQLGYPQPNYAHLPVAVNAQGEKLSKQTQASAIDEWPHNHALLAALHFLGQNPPNSLKTASLTRLWEWALQHWSPARIPACAQQVFSNEHIAEFSYD